MPKEIGVVTHYYNHIQVAVVKLKAALTKGDKIKIKGSTTDFEQSVASMQIEHKSVEKVAKGAEIGLKVNNEVREHDIVYKL